MSKILFKNISQLITNQGVARKGGVLIHEDDLGIIENGALVWDSKKGIEWLGETKKIPKKYKKIKSKDLSGKILSPAFCDSHTHLVFAGNRDLDFKLKILGKSYQEIETLGGGIKSTVLQTRKASEKTLFELAVQRINTMMRFGTGIIEIKSGYGLNLENEIKILNVIQKLKRYYKNKIIIKSTFLGAHDFPLEAKTSRDKIKYFNELLNEALPLIQKKKLADAVDVFCDEGYFTNAQARRLLRRAATLGFDIKIHADEFTDTNGARLAAELGCLSADHLLKANQEGLEWMGRRGVVANLLPGTAFFLKLPFPNIQNFRDACVCLSLATDYNPGSSPVLSIPFIMTLACLYMKMKPEEAFAAVTFGGAKALGVFNQNGFLRVGFKPKIAIFNVPNYLSLMTEIAGSPKCELIL